MKRRLADWRSGITPRVSQDFRNRRELSDGPMTGWDVRNVAAAEKPQQHHPPSAIEGTLHHAMTLAPAPLEAKKKPRNDRCHCSSNTLKIKYYSEVIE